MGFFQTEILRRNEIFYRIFYFKLCKTVDLKEAAESSISIATCFLGAGEWQTTLNSKMIKSYRLWNSENRYCNNPSPQATLTTLAGNTFQRTKEQWLFGKPDIKLFLFHIKVQYEAHTCLTPLSVVSNPFSLNQCSRYCKSLQEAMIRDIFGSLWIRRFFEIWMLFN